MCGPGLGDLRGSRGSVSAEIYGKSARKSPARLPSGTQIVFKYFGSAQWCSSMGPLQGPAETPKLLPSHQVLPFHAFERLAAALALNVAAA